MLTWQLTTSDLNNNRIGFFRIYIYIFTFPMFVLSSSVVKRRNQMSLYKQFLGRHHVL